MPPDDLRTIRTLSQYRPFTEGGTSVREAHQDIVLAALAESGGECGTLAECRSAVATLFGIDLEEVSVANALTQLIRDGRVSRGTGFALVAAEASSATAKCEHVAETLLLPIVWIRVWPTASARRITPTAVARILLAVGGKPITSAG